MSLVIVGSVAFDTLETPYGRREKIVGGSCTYCSLAASFFTQPKIVAVVGEDFPEETIELFKSRGIDVRGLEIQSGKTFHWEARYGDDPNQRTTIKTELNVFEDFSPQLPPDYTEAEIVFLANIDPDLQGDILSQVKHPKLVAMDTMNLWIKTKPAPLLRVLEKVNVYFANDEEIKMLAKEPNLIKAGKKLLERGPSFIVIKKGEHGALVLGKDSVFGVLAYPCEKVIDPTGAGDSFAGGFLGYLDKIKAFDEEGEIRKASVYGSVLASFTIEDFGINRFKSLSLEDIEKRFSQFKKLVSF
ncbi:MAG: sugar kinase [Candidatus Aminicenantes bacterium]|nr:MAG: sugar kinase [Candidatus Aminicenantes bacterium]